MTTAVPVPVYRSDYAPPDYIVDCIDLRIEPGEETTRVVSHLVVRATFDNSQGQKPLLLDGRRFRLCSVLLDGVILPPERYTVTDEQLIITTVPALFSLEVISELQPQNNTFLEGLYCSNGMFCTQCEAQGFRSITYYPDRPDVLSVFTVTIVADREKYPVLLSNGNLQEEGELPDGRHFARWHDPFPKPSYLFAMVAGNLACISDSFCTCSGREVALRIYVHEHNRRKCDHAMRSLKKAMRWDEQTFGREYDLDCFMIVAVDDFNMGAMENKGLNIFNSRYVLASPETATDDDYHAIEGVIGHEYFHNWSGNRVTCRDWFQLSLKEGFTVFRDQEFSSDMGSRGVQRIADVRTLRTVQFAEDGGPMAHPVRPDSYIEINNFYTVTVYEKGAEVVRMLHTLLGAERFRRGTDLYFERHDGQAVAVDDFVQAMADAGAVDLKQFALWYSQAGTPLLKVSGVYDPSAATYTVTVRQSCPPTPGQPEKKPLLMPLTLGLLGQDGSQLPLIMSGESGTGATTRVLQLHEAEASFCFCGLPEQPVPALLRGFSAPVRLEYPYRMEELALLMAHEPDPFCRWEASQRMASQTIMGLMVARQQGRALELEPCFADAFRKSLTNGQADPAFLAEMLTLPSEKYLAELVTMIDPEAIHSARQYVLRSLGSLFKEELLEVRCRCRIGKVYTPQDGRAGQRRLANLCLAYLMSAEDSDSVELCFDQYQAADNMTDSGAALMLLASCECPQRRAALEHFYQRWQDERLVVDKWFTLQATSTLPTALAEVRLLLEHSAFELGNPNRFRSLVGAFSQGNQVRFHDPNGAGYRFLTDQLLRLIPINPQVSARLLAPLTTWHRFENGRSRLMQQELQRIQSSADLPRDVYEVVQKSLA
jgi:aminopeptidase N